MKIGNQGSYCIAINTDKQHLDIDLAISPERAAANMILKVLDIPHATSVSDFMDGKVKLFILIRCTINKPAMTGGITIYINCVSYNIP